VIQIIFTLFILLISLNAQMIDCTNIFLSKLIMLKAQDSYVLRYCYRYKRRAVTNNKINPENGRLNAIYMPFSPTRLP
jgi:hypothetical protein